MERILQGLPMFGDGAKTSMYVSFQDFCLLFNDAFGTV